MDRKACLEGQLLVREITHEYRMLLELLEDPQILVNGDPGEVDEVLKVVQQKQNLTSSPLSSIVTLSWKLAKLQECYNICLVNNHFEVKEDQSEVHLGSPADNESLVEKVQKTHSNLKRLNGELQQLIWEIDQMKRM